VNRSTGVDLILTQMIQLQVANELTAVYMFCTVACLVFCDKRQEGTSTEGARFEVLEVP